jgi:hypothetical protein
VHAGGERRLLQLLLDRLRLEAVEASRADETTRVHEARELVAGEEHLLELRIARHREVLGMRENGLDQLLGVALLAQDRRAVLWVLVERRVDFVVEVVEQRDATPELLVLLVQARVVADGRLDCESVAEERFVLRVARERVPRLVTGRAQGRLG